MRVKISSRKRNPLLKRREIIFEVEPGEKGGTPPRFEVRRELALALKADLELVYVERMETKTGSTTVAGEAHIYDFPDQAKLVEPEHILARNEPPKKPQEGR